MTKIPDYLEIEQVDEILKAAETSSLRDYLLLRFMWRTGVRVSEVLNVTPKDVEFKNRVVNIRKAKGGRQRGVPLDKDSLEMLSEYISALNIPEDRPVFPIKRDRVFKIVKKYEDIAGVKIHLHTLRHSFAVHMGRSGTDLRRLQLMLGHTSLSTTQVYLQFNDDDLRDAYEKVAF